MTRIIDLQGEADVLRTKQFGIPFHCEVKSKYSLQAFKISVKSKLLKTTYFIVFCSLNDPGRPGNNSLMLSDCFIQIYVCQMSTSCHGS